MTNFLGYSRYLLPLLLFLILCSIPILLLSKNEQPQRSTNQDTERDTELLSSDPYDSALKEIQAAIANRDFAKAEVRIEEHKPTFENKWGVGEFSYTAYLKLGDAYRDNGNLSDAMRVYKRAEPGGGCGNCMASQQIYLDDRIAKLYEARLNFPGSFLTYTQALRYTDLGDGVGVVFLGLLRSGGVCLLTVGLAIWSFHLIIRKKKRRRVG